MSKKYSFFKKHFDLHGPVFWPSAIFILLFIIVTLVVGKPMNKVFSAIQAGISHNFGWLFILAVNVFLVFCAYLIFSPFGKIRIGGPKAKPQFSLVSWFAMLFSAGMGIGIIFWSVAEPIYHFNSFPGVAPGTEAAAKNAMQYAFLHWGFHTWAIYAVVGLALAYFTFNKKLPLTFRSVFYPLLGDKIYGPIGHLIDILSVVATLFGLATSLGFGVQQVGAGLQHLVGWVNDTSLQIILIGLITGVATISVVTGLDKGVRILSNVNLYLALAFMILMVLIGPTLFIIESFIENTGNYFQKLLSMGMWNQAYAVEKYVSDEFVDWQSSWTVFYWAWWISWSPFVGTFIARISKGRTIRDFVLGVLVVPSLIGFLWFSTFGGSGLFLELTGTGEIAAAVQADISTAMYVMLHHYPLAFFTSIICMILVINFFVTSSDSGSLVIDSITAGGKLDAPVGQRIFWALIEGVVAAVLLYGGGLQAIQTASIISGLPFVIVLLIMVFSLVKSLRKDQRKMEKKEIALYRVLSKKRPAGYKKHRAPYAAPDLGSLNAK